MLSALLGQTENSGQSEQQYIAKVTNEAGSPVSVSDRSQSTLLFLGGSGGTGLAGLDEQTVHQRTYAPLPAPGGELIHDPDFTLPTTAGPLSWRLFYYSQSADLPGAFGYGRRASWPLRLCVDRNPSDGPVLTVTLEREDGLGARYVSENGGVDYIAVTPRIFDTLHGDPDTGFVETRLDTGDTFHYPAGMFTTLSYYQTVFDQMVSFGLDDLKRLQTITDPATRVITYSYDDPEDPAAHVSMVQDWAGRIHTFTYDS